MTPVGDPVGDFSSVTSRSYGSRVREVDVSGQLFLSKELAFNMEAQQMSQWCWAATAKSVSHFYWRWSTWRQCLIVNGELNLTTCCQRGLHRLRDCNRPWWLERALTRTNNLRNWIMGPASFQQVREEIDLGRPVGARIGWPSPPNPPGAGHFAVIYGYSRIGGTEYFDIDDSIYGKSVLSVTVFSNSYQGTGTWTHTYFTRGFFRLPIKVEMVSDPILQSIWEVRPLLKMKQEMAARSEAHNAAEEWRTSLGMAHRIYSLGLESLTSESEPPRPEPIGLRVYEVADDEPRAFFDVSDDEQQPQVQQMSASKNHLEPFARGLEEALATVERSDQECELRLFRVPALNFEALWINYGDENNSEGEARDSLVPLREVGTLPLYQAVPFDEAMDALREAAAPLEQLEDDMLGG
jgi:hypothetical protein